MSILIVQPVNLAPPGEILLVLDACGESYEILRMEDRVKLPIDYTSYDGLIILGGTMGANDEAEFPFLTELKKTIQHFYQQEKPVLGVCLGAQLIASSFSAKVGKMPEAEFGITELKKTSEGNRDPLFSKLPDTFSFMEWHEDYFELPGEAILLASGTHCKNQAFRIKDYIYGFQFHPEVNEPILENWVEEKRNWIVKQDPGFLEEVDSTIKPSLSHSIRHCHELVREWVGLVRIKRRQEADRREVVK